VGRGPSRALPFADMTDAVGVESGHGRKEPSFMLPFASLAHFRGHFIFLRECAMRPSALLLVPRPFRA
jgi:hypothetical protein